MSLIKQSKPINVSIYFGKKDSILLYLLYEDVSSSDFNFIVKAILKHHINNALFHVHNYINLERIIELYDEIEDDGDIEIKKQRNIRLTPQDDFIYKWISDTPESRRPQEVKLIIIKQLKECIDLYKNPQKKKEPFPQQLVVLSDFPYKDVNNFENLTPMIQNALTQVKPRNLKNTPINTKFNDQSVKTLKSLKGNPIGQLGKQ